MLIQHGLEHEPDARLPTKFADMDIRDLVKPESTSTSKVESPSPTLSMMQTKSNSFSFTSSVSLPPLSATQLALPLTSDLSKYCQGSAVGNSNRAVHYNQPGQIRPNAQPRTQSSGYQQAQHQRQTSHWTNGYPCAKRTSPPDDNRSGPPPKKQTKWTPEEDRKIIAYRGQGMKWSEISARLEPRSEIGCRLHYQNYLEKRSDWDEEKKNKLARVYERVKEDMWKLVANEMKIPWRSAEGMHWIMGETEMARRANVTPFSNTIQSSSLSNTATTTYSNANTNGHSHQRTPSYRNTNNTIVFDPEQLATLKMPLTKGPVSTFAVGEPGIKRESMSSERTQVASSPRYAGQSDHGHNGQHPEDSGENPQNLSSRSSQNPKEISLHTSHTMQEVGILLPSVSDMECMVPVTASAPATIGNSRFRKDSESNSVCGGSSTGSASGRTETE